MSLSNVQLNALHDWNQRHSIRNFLRMYRHGFNYKWLIWRPLWRIWRIIRNTYLTDNYLMLEKMYQD